MRSTLPTLPGRRPAIHAALSLLPLLGALLAPALVPGGAAAQVPQKVGFQGYLTDALGTPLADGTYGIVFRIYGTATGGSPLWTESDNLDVADGIFHALLGGTTPLTLQFDQPYWVGVDVDGQGELDPRTELAASPYAHTATGLAADSVLVRIGGQTRAAFENSGALSMRRSDGTETAKVSSDYTGGGLLELWNDTGQLTVHLLANSGTESGVLTIGNDLGQPSIYMRARENGTQGANVSLRTDANVATIELDAEDDNDGGTISVRDAAGQTTVKIVGQDADGLGRIVTDVVEIVGGADLSEQFDVSGADVQPGMVVSIDAARPGGLAVSTSPYDSRVAGVISGAGGVRPGMLMGQAGSVADGDHPVALTGRVWVHADASFGAIAPGDLLTTSSTPGHAMRAADPSRAHGTTLGKAMTSLASGRGLVLVLVNLQ